MLAAGPIGRQTRPGATAPRAAFRGHSGSRRPRLARQASLQRAEFSTAGAKWSKGRGGGPVPAVPTRPAAAWPAPKKEKEQRKRPETSQNGTIPATDRTRSEISRPLTCRTISENTPDQSKPAQEQTETATAVSSRVQRNNKQATERPRAPWSLLAGQTPAKTQKRHSLDKPERLKALEMQKSQLPKPLNDGQ